MKKYTYEFYSEVFEGKLVEVKSFIADSDKEADKMCYDYAVRTHTFRSLINVEEEKDND